MLLVLVISEILIQNGIFGSLKWRIFSLNKMQLSFSQIAGQSITAAVAPPIAASNNDAVLIMNDLISESVLGCALYTICRMCPLSGYPTIYFWTLGHP
jgi:hypothetical protein